ncbi:MAG: hypothetical protein R3A78_10015 [Polyangiales bacterium]
MRRTFNLGVGFLFVVAAESAERVVQALHGSGEQAWVCGHLEQRTAPDQNDVTLHG